ncbi:unnamed protein product [Lepidochelys olivacea]
MDFEAPATSTAFRKRVCGKVLPFQGEMGLFTQIKTISIIKVRQKVLGQPLRRTHCFSFSCTAGEKVWGLISTCPRRLQALESSERILFTRMEMFSFGMYDQESPLSLSHSGLCSS